MSKFRAILHYATLLTCNFSNCLLQFNYKFSISFFPGHENTLILAVIKFSLKKRTTLPELVAAFLSSFLPAKVPVLESTDSKFTMLLSQIKIYENKHFVETCMISGESKSNWSVSLSIFAQTHRHVWLN